MIDITKLPKSKASKGHAIEKRVAKYMEGGNFNGENMCCYVAPYSKFDVRDIFGFDLVCVGRKSVVFVQVKYENSRKPPCREATLREMRRVRMPKSVRRIWLGVDGRTGEVSTREL